jgi:PAS domain S-box-containing protein
MALALSENREYHGHEILIERPDGTRVTALAHVSPLRDEAGAITGAMNIVVDISERKLADEIRAHLAAIVSSSQDAIISTRLDGIITSWNGGAERLYGYAAEEVVGRPMTLLVPPDRSDEFPAIMARIHRGERVEPHETERVAQDGRRVAISLAVSPIRTADGRLIGASAIARDITQRKQAQEALRRSERELADFFENSVVGLHWAGPDGTILWANQAELDLLGYSREEYIGHHIAEFHADPETIADMLVRLGRGEELHSYEARLRGKDASIRHVLISSNVLWEDGTFIHTRCFTRDITERKAAEEARERLADENARLYRQAQAALEARNQVLSQVAHDLKNAVAAITGTAQLLERQQARTAEEPEAKLMAGLQQITARAGGMTAYLNELLDAAQLIAGRPLALDRQPTDLVALAHQVVADLQQVDPTHAITVAAPTAELIGSWDRFRLERVLRNLLSNAIKYSPEGGPITTAIAEDRSSAEPCAQLVVQDHGVGIPAEDLPHIFTPFFRASNIEGRVAGTGIGLAGVRAVVEQHGGTLTIASEEGVGTGVTLRLPLASPEPPGAC